MRESVRSRYTALVKAGEIEDDPAQSAVVTRLDRLADALESHRISRKSGALGWLFSRSAPQSPKGLYLWGGVGRGKTMLMDLFYAAAPVRRKRRAHFHAFMAEVHERLHDMRRRLKSGAAKGDDPVAPVADALAEDAWLLCFDELQVEDIADAMILGRLFERLFAQGVVCVATSNTPPGRLYEGGLNRPLFLPFIDLIETRMEVVELQARTDYRAERLAEVETYVTPLGPAAEEAMDRTFARLTRGMAVAPETLRVKGRTLRVARAADGVARFGFGELCEVPLGAADYLALAERYHTLMIDGVRVLRPAERDAARRFVTLIDTLYDARVRLVLSAAAEPQALYPVGDGARAFMRTASRLFEMRSPEYLATAGPGRANAGGGVAAA
ncbi:MAG: cell division protein ZapE, partial [Pseudomonadota bacterium]|nr:cell division protein ZapE [Pseudomonadota bacterium]